MPAFGNIASDDRESTPVTHTFTPWRMSEDNTVAFFKEAGATPWENNVLSLGIRATSANQNSKVRMKIEMPVVATEVINGVNYPKLLRTAIADVTFTFAKSSTTQERDNIVGILVNTLAGSALANDVIVDLNSVT